MDGAFNKISTPSEVAGKSPQPYSLVYKTFQTPLPTLEKAGNAHSSARGADQYLQQLPQINLLAARLVTKIGR
jgi:hypothetical protein